MRENNDVATIYEDLEAAAEKLKEAIDDIVETPAGDARLDFIMRIDPALDTFRAALKALDD